MPTKNSADPIVNVRMPCELVERLLEVSRQRRLPVSALVRGAVVEFLAHEREEQDK